MDDRLKQKLELLGEPTLPDSLTAEELFRRIDCGELVLPEETEVEAEAAPSDNVIPWAKILRRGVPIAACLALVVFIAQGRIWKMGSSGGANLSGSADAPQAAAAADQTAPAEKYSLDGEAETPAPEPFRSITIEEDDQEAEVTKSAADDIAEEEVFDDVAEEDEALRPDSGWDNPDNANPDSGPVVNPDIGWEHGGRGPEPEFELDPLLREIFGQLYLRDKALTGLTPVLSSFTTYYDGLTPISVEGICDYENDAGEEVAHRIVYCTVTQKADGGYSLTLLAFKEWNGVEDTLIDWEDLGIPAIGWGGAGEKTIEPPYDLYPMKPYVMEIFEQLYLQDKALIGLTPTFGGCQTEYDDSGTPVSLTSRCQYLNDAGEEAAWRDISCTVTTNEDGTYSLTLLSVWEPTWE